MLNAVSPQIIGFIRKLMPQASYMTTLFCVNAAYYLLCAVLPVWLYARKRGGLKLLRLEPPGAKKSLMCVLAAAICVLCAEYLASFWVMLLEGVGLVMPQTNIPIANSSELTIAIFTIGVLPGICEELVFRGMIFGAYERGGTFRALCVSALMFMGLHGSITGAPTEFLLGVALGALVAWTGSLYSAMLFHTAYNSFLVLLSYFAGGVETGEYTTMFEYLGGWTAVIILIFQTIGLGVALFFLLRAVYRRRAANAVIPASSLRLDIPETLILISGAVTVAYFYVLDFLEMLGS